MMIKEEPENQNQILDVNQVILKEEIIAARDKYDEIKEKEGARDSGAKSHSEAKISSHTDDGPELDKKRFYFSKTRSKSELFEPDELPKINIDSQQGNVMETDGPYIQHLVNGFKCQKIYSTNEDAYIEKCHI